MGGIPGNVKLSLDLLSRPDLRSPSRFEVPDNPRNPFRTLKALDANGPDSGSSLLQEAGSLVDRTKAYQAESEKWLAEAKRLRQEILEESRRLDIPPDIFSATWAEAVAASGLKDLKLSPGK